jgi:hypothetical protein
MRATYQIPDCNLAAFVEQVQKLNKRALKLGCEPIRLNAGENEVRIQIKREQEKQFVKSGEVPEGWTPTGEVMVWHAVTVEGETPSFNGWKLIAVLEAIADDSGKQQNIIRTIPGEECPASYRDKIGTCDYCHTKRYRSETFVVEHTDGTRKIVGRQCLKDFLCYHKDPHNLATMAELLSQLSDFANIAQRDPGWGEHRGDPTWSLEHFLALTIAVIRERGWLPKSKAEEGKVPTASLVTFLLQPCPSEGAARREWKELSEACQVDDDCKSEAEKAIDWARDLEILSTTESYLANVNTIARCGYVQWRFAGIAASIYRAYLRATNQLDAATKSLSNEHVGEAGKRIELTLTCLDIFSKESAYGTTGVHKLRDEAGNDLVWFASHSSTWLRPRGTYHVKATIKSHSEFNGRKQTVLSRVAVLEEVTK